MTNETPFAVDASGLCRRYGRRWALIDVSLQIPAGTVVMVTGRNGSGTSTLLRVLSTAIRADRGTARVAGFDLRTATQDLRKRVALLSHHSHLYEALSALENLQVAARFLGREAARLALLPILDEVGLADRADDGVATFSAGMRKRLSLARVLLQEASVVFLDEPYGQLDPQGFRLVDALLDRLRSQGTTVLMATHLLERGSALCDLGVVLEEGRRQWFGPAIDLPRHGGLDPAGLPEGD
ncbi:MAG: heme ABC exporter ATP-binding protein CcmA [Vicinamibacteria bacterium]